MKPVCSRHPEQPAHWLCPKCKQPFCSDCVITLDASSIGGTQVVRFCRKCMIETNPIGVPDVVIPFWKRIFSPSKLSPSPGEFRSSAIRHFNALKLSKLSPPPGEFGRHPGKPETAADDPAETAIIKIDALCGENKRDMALDHIRQWMKNGGMMNAALAERYSDLLIKAGQTDELRNHAPLLLKFLIAASDGQRAITVFDACGDVTSDFTITIDPATLLTIGDMFSANGRARDAIKVFSLLTKNNPKAPETPLAYVKAAQTCHERLMASDLARKILEQLIQKYPDHAMLPAFKSYLARIGK